MSQNPNMTGRVDHLAARVFKTLLQRHGNPQTRILCKVFEDEITECFEENLGPGTKAHRVGSRLIRAVEGK